MARFETKKMTIRVRSKSDARKVAKLQAEGWTIQQQRPRVTNAMIDMVLTRPKGRTVKTSEPVPVEVFVQMPGDVTFTETEKDQLREAGERAATRFRAEQAQAKREQQIAKLRAADAKKTEREKERAARAEARKAATDAKNAAREQRMADQNAKQQAKMEQIKAKGEQSKAEHRAKMEQMNAEHQAKMERIKAEREAIRATRAARKAAKAS